MNSPNVLIPILADTFGAEWDALPQSDRDNILPDWNDALRKDCCTCAEYRRRIGAGNLQSYANCIRGNK